MRKYNSKLTIQKINSIEGENFLIFGKNGKLFAKAYNRPDADLIASIPVKENRIKKAIAEIEGEIDGGEELRGHDAMLSRFIHILKGEI